MDTDSPICKDPIQERLEKSIPWIGRYIFAASLICTLAMAADAFNSFRRKKLWFPCRYFSLDATSLTLLGVAMKLPMDLTISILYTDVDMIAKLSSIVFMSTAIGNFMSSLGSMNDREILPNVLALGILVFTIAVDVLIQLILLLSIISPFYYLLSTVLMLLCLAMLVSLAVTVPNTKRSLESKYDEKHRVTLQEEGVLQRREAFRIDDKKGYMMKYWVMAETSNPQFVMARSVVSTNCAVICLLAAFLLATLYPVSGRGGSPYKESTTWILYVQSIGVVVGTIAPVLRWFVVVSFKCSMNSTNRLRESFKIEPYWTQTLVEWRDNFSALRIKRQDKYRKYLHDAKWYAVTFCIGLQILNVLLSKLLISFSALLTSPFFLCVANIRRFAKQERDDKDLNYLRSFVLLLEDEPELPTRVLRNICREADNMIRTGQKKQPLNLIDLLKNKFIDFNGLGQFDSDQIPSILPEEPQNCWTLPVVTLTSIAITLPNIAKHKSEQLLSGVSQGLSLAKLVEKPLVKKAQLTNIRKGADMCWVGVILYTKWFDMDLRRTSLGCRNSKEVLEKLSYKAQKHIKQFLKDSDTHDPLPPEVAAANSMYRISQTILLSCEEEAKSDQSNDGLFGRISIMISDILAACLTNLPHVITTRCHHNAIEKREKSVRKAFLLLGKTENLIQLLQQTEWPFLDHDKAASMEEWRALFRQNNGSLAAISSDETVTAAVCKSEELLDVKVDC